MPGRTQVEAREEWLIVVRGDGRIEAVGGSAPLEWTGKLVESAWESHPELLAELPKLARAPRLGPVHRSIVLLERDHKNIHVELLLDDSIPIRRALTKMDDLVMSVIEVFTNQAHTADVLLRVRMADDLPKLALIDSEKIRWALSTLIGNSLRHLVRASAPGSEKTAKTISVEASWDPSEDDIVLAVIDNGPGLPRHTLEWLFDRDPLTGRPAGVALLMVRDVIVAHRGSIEAASDARATRFQIRLPRRVSGDGD